VGPRRLWEPPAATPLVKAPELEVPAFDLAPRKDVSGGATGELLKKPTPMIPAAPIAAEAPAADTAAVANKQAPKSDWKNYLGSFGLGALGAADLGVGGALGAGGLAAVLRYLLRNRDKPKDVPTTASTATTTQKAALGGMIGEDSEEEPAQMKAKGGVIRKRPKGSKDKDEKEAKARKKKDEPPPIPPYAEGEEVEPEPAPTGEPMAFAAGGAAKVRKGYPGCKGPKKYAKGGAVRGCGAATKGKNFSGVY
jgi:hypothetical protein